MTEDQIRAFLIDWAIELASFEEGEAAGENGWFGAPPAHLSQISTWEDANRLRLPKSYRDFLGVTNGWRWLGPSHLFGGSLLAIENVAPLRTSHPDLLEAYEVSDDDPSEAEHRRYGSGQDASLFRRALLKSAFQISEFSAGGVYLLVPTIQTVTGEWEAWHFADWFAGARRHETFLDLLRAERSRLRMRLRGPDPA